MLPFLLRRNTRVPLVAAALAAASSVQTQGASRVIVHAGCGGMEVSADSEPVAMVGLFSSADMDRLTGFHASSAEATTGASVARPSAS
ncbi:MAG: hypothetical protein AAF791_00510 [Bacteroidota bacterium]